MNKNRFLLGIFVLLSLLISSACTMQGTSRADTSMFFIIIFIFLLVVAVFLISGFGRSDNLTDIEGIGPEIEKALKSKGIKTYAKLAKTDKAEIDKVLADGKFNLAQSDTWQKQAELARDGKWAELNKYKEELKAGL
jgi:hypothetical protein